MRWKGLGASKQLGKSIETVQQGECPKITASNLVSSESVRRLLALLVLRDFLMDTNRNGIRVNSNTQWHCVRNFSGGSLQCTLCHGRNRCDQGFAFKRNTCELVVTHATFLCIPWACFDVDRDAFLCPRNVIEDVQQTLAMSFGEMCGQVFELFLALMQPLPLSNFLRETSSWCSGKSVGSRGWNALSTEWRIAHVTCKCC